MSPQAVLILEEEESIRQRIQKSIKTYLGDRIELNFATSLEEARTIVLQNKERLARVVFGGCRCKMSEILAAIRECISLGLQRTQLVVMSDDDKYKLSLCLNGCRQETDEARIHVFLGNELFNIPLPPVRIRGRTWPF